jgi:hypothetical protein
MKKKKKEEKNSNTKTKTKTKTNTKTVSSKSKSNFYKNTGKQHLQTHVVILEKEELVNWSRKHCWDK